LAGAVAAFQRAVELNPDFEDAHYNLGLALRARGKTDAAQKEMSEIRGLHEFRNRLAQAKLLILQGVGALKEQRFDDALASFQQSIEKGPNCRPAITTWVSRGSARTMLSRPWQRTRKHSN
jgi:superkiller protein 3